MSVDDALAAARLVLERLGVSPQDLIADGRRTSAVPLEELVEKVKGVLPAPSLRLYEPYFRKALRAWPNKVLHDLLPSDVTWFVNHCRDTAVERRSSRGGHSAAEHAYDAVRCLMKYAVVHRMLFPWDDPTDKIAKPPRLVSKRRALEPELVENIIDIAATTGNDPHLDTLILRFHMETAARRGGALGLKLGDLDPTSLLVKLREKGKKDRWQPVSPTLMRGLQTHADLRGAAAPGDVVLRYHNGDPLSARRYDGLWDRIGRHLDTVRLQGVSTHWLRHTTLTWVERAFGYAVARAYAGHATASTNRFGVTATYVKADLADVAAALSALTGEPHPLATRDRDLSRWRDGPEAQPGLDTAV